MEKENEFDLIRYEASLSLLKLALCIGVHSSHGSL